jgi:uncharacterized protein YgiM (DUF1202 family)
MELVAPEDALDDYLTWIELTEVNSTNETVEAPLEDVSLTMTEGQVYRYDFRGTAGQNLSAAARVADDSELDPLLVLLDPAGDVIEADDDSGVNLDAVIPTYSLPDTGLYTLVISHAGGGFDGTMTLSLRLDGEAGREFSIYELRVNDPVRVYTTAGDNLNLRSGPGLNFDIIARLEKDSEATLLEGPRKADGYAWWRIQTADGQEGWAVERADEEQTLQPPLLIGSQATVYPLSGDRLNVREDAGRSFEIVTQLEQGAVVTILGGPVEADDFRWWQIRTDDGLEVWAVDEADGEQTIIGLAPAVDAP